jgi:hypothetical protein
MSLVDWHKIKRLSVLEPRWLGMLTRFFLMNGSICPYYFLLNGKNNVLSSNTILQPSKLEA